MLNSLTLQGRFTTNPECKNIKGNNICQFNIASKRNKNKDGEIITDFIPVVAFGKKAEFIAKNFYKGDMIIINGRMQSRNYSDSEGRSRTAYECYVIDCFFCGASAGHCATSTPVQDNTFSPNDDDINWDEIPDLPSEF